VSELHQGVREPRERGGIVAGPVTGITEDEDVRTCSLPNITGDALGVDLEALRELDRHRACAPVHDPFGDLVQSEVEQ